METIGCMELLTNSFVIVLLLISTVNATTINNQVFDDNKRQVSYFSSSPYGLTQCLKLCSLDGRCVSINYRPGSYTCEMVETNVNAAPDQTGWLFTSDLSLVAGTLGSCKDVTLQEYDVCVLLKSGSNSLVTKYIRLVGGSSNKEGRVEILYNGNWGTICDDGFGTPDATVVCNQLGYSGGEAYSRAYFGEGTGPVWMEELDCTGSECNLADCPFPGWGNVNCNHREDAGVKCT
ncbi:scavenger receptor cysteine-rich type 1 protein M130-like isoform X2 [Argopecten irradians]|uniref:scavenger receptor cysteine-rich type 1 protein M130-like isoform X2 n=1 Tax=Argopecten irradians TaxID=31199 RepID=UPI0037203DC4